MRASKFMVSVVFLFLALSGSGLSAQSAAPNKEAPAASLTASSKPMSDAEKAEMAERVRAETLHAWNGYKKYAWGHDALKPLTPEAIRLVWGGAQPVDDAGGCAGHADADGA